MYIFRQFQLDRLSREQFFLRRFFNVENFSVKIHPVVRSAADNRRQHEPDKKAIRKFSQHRKVILFLFCTQRLCPPISKSFIGCTWINHFRRSSIITFDIPCRIHKTPTTFCITWRNQCPFFCRNRPDVGQCHVGELRTVFPTRPYKSVYLTHQIK